MPGHGGCQQHQQPVCSESPRSFERRRAQAPTNKGRQRTGVPLRDIPALMSGKPGQASLHTARKANTEQLYRTL